MRNRILLVVIALLAVQTAFTQNGSPYTRYGLGSLTTPGFGPAKAMGGVSYAYTSGRNLNISNPSALASIDSLSFIFEFGLESDFRQMATVSPNLSTVNNDTRLSYLSLGFPITRWWASSIGIMPFSTMGYNIRSSDTLLNVSKYYYYKGSGGINQVFWSHGFSPFTNFRLGLNMKYLFGMQNRTNSIKFDDESGAYVNILEENIVYVNDFCFTAGAQYDFILDEKSTITLGAVFTYPTRLNSRRDALVTNSLSVGGSMAIDTIFCTENELGEISLPLSIGGGILYNYDDRLKLGFDYSMQNWSNAMFFNQSDSLGNSNCVRMGLEYTPAGLNRVTNNYGSKVSYRLGFYYDNTYINFASTGEQIDDFGISFGLGLPLNRSKTSFNISIELGQRGTTRSNLVRERYANIGLNLTLSDVWFIKRKFD